METIKSIASGLKNNLVGTILGGIAGYYTAKKLGHVEHKLGLGLSIVAGAIVGSVFEYNIKAANTKPAIDASKK